MSRDLRKYAQDTNTRLVIGAFLLLFLVGDGLIYLFYGKGAALMGLLCLLAGVSPLLLILLVMLVLDWIVKRANED